MPQASQACTLDALQSQTWTPYFKILDPPLISTYTQSPKEGREWQFACSDYI